MAAPLPDGWAARVSSSTGRTYYVCAATGATQWELPTAPAGPLPSTVRASHLLCKHTGSRRPSSWREAVITRSKQEAIDKLAGLRARIASGAASFEDLARAESDCSSAAKGGDLGTFGHGDMQKPFEDATFALQVGELSGIIETESGVHIIRRTA